ncbi:MAG TPA: hypothetical protein VK939_12275 [Longimicrobiales bacterium]|nr:hypothetical protein [Longimicrobiales bacterium]
MNAPDAQPETGRFFAWQVVAALSMVVLLLLAVLLWRRLESVDPLGRCVAAYESARTPTDSSLVDGIRVRTPDRSAHTTCGDLRATGMLENVPRVRRGPGLLPPRPQ